MITFQSLTRSREIGASCHLLRFGNATIMLDAGMHPKLDGYESLADTGSLAPGAVDALLISHAHHDHIGGVPVVQREQPGMPVYCSEGTGRLGDAILHNSVNVMTSQRQELGISEYPLFSHQEVEESVEDWLWMKEGRRFELGETQVRAELFDAGHLLGSSGILLEHEGTRIFYTGDVHFENQTIMRAANFPRKDIDVLIMETTRGANDRPEAYSREGEMRRLAQVISETWDRGGAVLMPVFAMGKSQEMMIMLHLMKRARMIPEMPVFIGGLTTKMTVIYDDLSARTRRQHEGFRILDEVDLRKNKRRSKAEIQYEPRTIFALSSGMMTENTVSNNFARQFLDNPKNTLIFVGYTDPESPGGKIRHADPGTQILLNKNYPTVPLKCRVEEFDFSGHATRTALLDYVRDVRPKKLFLVHGDPAAQDWFYARVKEEMPEVDVIRQEPGQEIPIL